MLFISDHGKNPIHYLSTCCYLEFVAASCVRTASMITGDYRRNAALSNTKHSLKLGYNVFSQLEYLMYLKISSLL